MSEAKGLSEEEQEKVISDCYDSINDEIEKLQNKLKWPDEFIYDFLETIRDHYSPTSDFARIRKTNLKKRGL